MQQSTATADIESLLKETDQFLTEHNLAKPLSAGGVPAIASESDDDDDDPVSGRQVDRLLRDTDSLLRDIGQVTTSPPPPPSPPPLHDDSDDSLSYQHVKSTRLPFDESDGDVAALADEVSVRPSVVEPGPRLNDVDLFPLRSADSTVSEQDLAQLNRVLTRCGFPCFEESQPTRSDLYKALVSVLTQYEVKGDLIQNLLDQQNRDKSLSGSQAEYIEATNKSLKAKLKEAHRNIEALKGSSMNHSNLELKNASSQNDLSRLRSKNQSLKAKIAVLENDLRKKEAALDQMRETISKLNAKENLRRDREIELFRKMFERGPRPASVKDARTLEMISAFESQRVRMQEEIDMLSRRIASLTENDARRPGRRFGDELRDTLDQLRADNARLHEELNVRPTKKLWDDVNDELKTVKAQLAEARSVADVRKRMSTRELVDRDVHRKTIVRIDDLPQTICVEILQDICRILELDDVVLIVPAIKKICSAVTKIPLLQNFVSEIVQISGLEIGDDVAVAANRVIPVIRSWKKDMRTLAQLETFQRDLFHRIQTRSKTALPRSKSEPRSESQCAAILSAVDELICTEASLLDTREAYENLHEHIKERPDILCNRIVQHFMQLFNVESIDGLLPAMSKISVDMESTRNFLRAVRSIVRLEPSASVSAIMARIERLAGDTLGGDRDDQADFQTVDLLIQLRRLLRVDSNGDVLGSCRKLIDRCALYDGLFPRVDRMINRLFNILHVHHMDEIVPAVQRLVIAA